MPEHYATKLKKENARLQAALDEAISALRCVPQSRFDKYKNEILDDSTLAYRKAVQEVDRLNLEAIDRIYAIVDETS